MIRGQFLGKIVFKVQDTLGVRVKEYGDGQPSLHGKDCVLNGHMLQAKPIGDVEANREPSPEERRKAEKAEASERTEGVVTKSDLGNQGQLFFQEFQDVVMLRRVHRTYDENDERVREMSSELTSAVSGGRQAFPGSHRGDVRSDLDDGRSGLVGELA